MIREHDSRIEKKQAASLRYYRALGKIYVIEREDIGAPAIVIVAHAAALWLRPIDEDGFLLHDMPRLSHYIALFAMLWMVVLTWRIYPQFRDALRVDGQLTTVEDYIDATCGERLGPAAATCLAEAREEAQHLLRREQGKSILLIEAPILGYFVFYLAAAIWRFARRTGSRA